MTRIVARLTRKDAGRARTTARTARDEMAAERERSGSARDSVPRVGALDWLRAHDRGFAAVRRAGRTAIVMPAVFAFGDKVLGNTLLGTFGAFGSFAMLLLVDFGGPMRDRLRNQAALACACGVLIVLATLVSSSTWLAAAMMAVIGFGVLFAGVASSVLAGATQTLLLSFILPVSLAGPASSIPDRLAGWGIASACSLLAISLLWPAPERDPVRTGAIEACRALAARLMGEQTPSSGLTARCRRCTRRSSRRRFVPPA